MMRCLYRLFGGAGAALILSVSSALMSWAQAPAPSPAPAQSQQQKPNILFIMGDDIGWMQAAADLE
jgi:hypothetical protein